MHKFLIAFAALGRRVVHNHQIASYAVDVGKQLTAEEAEELERELACLVVKTEKALSIEPDKHWPILVNKQLGDVC
jgi:hypothetical protein